MTDISDYEMPNIPFFKGVFPEKYDIDTIFTAQIMDSLRMESDEQETEFLKVYDKVPTEFTTIDKWPTSTNLECWRCRRTFKGVPAAVAISCANEGSTPAAKINTRGIMCSFFCAASYIDLHFPIIKVNWEKHEMLKILYKKMTGVSIEFIPRSPEPTCMVQCGGNDTPAEYGKKIALLANSIQSSIHEINTSSSTIMPELDALTEHI